MIDTPDHTPAPWSLHSDHGQTGPFFKVVDAQGVRVADIPVQPLDPPSWPQTNTCLTAALPELLEALQWQEMAEADPDTGRSAKATTRAPVICAAPRSKPQPIAIRTRAFA